MIFKGELRNQFFKKKNKSMNEKDYAWDIPLLDFTKVN